MYISLLYMIQGKHKLCNYITQISTYVQEEHEIATDV
jgi:hypothetical protein